MITTILVRFINDNLVIINISTVRKAGASIAPAFCLPSVPGTPGLLQEADVALTREKKIRIARALLVTVGSEGSDRK